MLLESFLAPYRDLRPPFGPLGELVFYRSYSRVIEDRKEHWFDATLRQVSGLAELATLHGVQPLNEQDERILFDSIFHMRGLLSGRAMWSLGSGTVRRIGAAPLNNCWFTELKSPSDYAFLLDCLMLGGGVGYSMCPSYFPPVREIKLTELSTGAEYQVEDSREGWVKCVEYLLEAHIAGKPLVYGLEKIRPRGTPLKSFGGTADGPEPLRRALGLVNGFINHKVRKYKSIYRDSYRMSAVELHHIACILADIRSESLRASAMLALGTDPLDKEFLFAKRWDKEPMPRVYANANNTLAVNDIGQLPAEYWEAFELDSLGNGRGEQYGLLNLSLGRRCGRLSDGFAADYGVLGCNPCAEQLLEHREPCNLANLVLPNIRSLDELNRVALILFKATKIIASAGYHNGAGEITQRNCRVGISVDGVCQFENTEWLNSCYRHLRGWDDQQPDYHKSIRITTVKPSGTQSLLTGVTAGAHAGFAPHYLRRVKVAEGPLRQAYLDAGYALSSDGQIEVPCSLPVTVPLGHEETALEQLDRQQLLQTVWSDSAVSITVYYKPEEIEDIRAYLRRHFATGIKTCSFMLRDNHGYTNAPFETITAEQFAARKYPLKPLKMTQAFRAENLIECGGGKCEVSNERGEG